MMDPSDTIVAVASPPGGSLRGVVRLSGPQAVEMSEGLIERDGLLTAKGPRCYDTQIELGELEADSRPLPASLFVWPGGRSYTCQPTVEIHTLGSPALLQMVVRRAQQLGCRLAEPGEFTLRAFLAGRIDLTQAEAVLGVIDASEADTLNVALQQLAGGMATPLAALREELLMLLAELEAGLDFAEEDVEFISAEVLAERLQWVIAELKQLVARLRSRGEWHEVPRVVLAGAPNAGKSSLFNALIERFGEGTCSQALVSSEPGATRDFLIARVRMGGHAIELVDTAGLENVASPLTIGGVAQSMSQTARERAALLVTCFDGAVAAADDSEDDTLGLRVLTKQDVLDTANRAENGAKLRTSAVTGEGLDELATAIAMQLTEQRRGAAHDEMVPATAARCDASLRAALEAACQAQELALSGESEELTAHELRRVLDELGQVAGVVASDDILDRVFRQFCIGK